MSEYEINKFFLSKNVPYVKPFYSIDITKDSEVLEWFKGADFNLNSYYRPLFQEQQNNLQIFVGAGTQPKFDTPFAAVFASMVDNYIEPKQIFLNEVYRTTMNQVSLIVANELIPDVLPNSEDYSDKVACNVTKDWLESINYDLNTEALRFQWEVAKKIFGECYAIVMWNPNIGDLHPMAKKFTDDDLEYVDENGDNLKDHSGNPMKIQKNTRIGDIEIITPFPWDVMIDPQNQYKDANWVFWKEHVDINYLKKKYPKYNWEETKSANSQYDPFTNSEKDSPQRKTIYYFYHRSHEFIPEGRFIVCSKDYVLVNEPMTLPTLVNNQELPIVRFVDLDLGYGTRGIPILLRNTKSIVDGYNYVTNQMYNNLEMESPKIFVHQNSGVDAQRMPNGTVAIEWTGNIKPTIETPSTNTSSIFNFRESIKKNIDEMAFQNPMVRGDTPNAQLDSFVSLQYFEDLRNQQASQDIKGHIRSMEHLYRLQITIAKDKYKPEDGRLIKILGKHNSYQLRYFDPINLQKSYDVKIGTTGNLANSKAARTQMLITIKRDFPQLLADEVFLDMLGLSHSKKFMNAVTSAVSSAESENQDMMSGIAVSPPSRFEDLITHWETHRIPMQTLDFKHSGDEIQDLFIGHIAAHEKLMFEQAAENPLFGQRLEALKQFPIFYTPKPVNEPTVPTSPLQESTESPMQEEGQAQAQGPLEGDQLPPNLPSNDQIAPELAQ